MNRISIAVSLAVVLLVVVSTALQAEVKMPFTFNKGMILQHGVAHPIWGMADPGEKVSLQFAGQIKEVIAGATGMWQVVLDPLAPTAPGSKPLEMIIKGTNTIKFSDIVVGEVWLSIASGAMGKRNLKIPKAEQASMYDAHLRIHLMPNANSILPVEQNFVACMWMDASKRRLNNWSAVPFYFLQQLKAGSSMPVGLLNGAFARGGSPHMFMPYSAHVFLKGEQYQEITNKMALNDITSETGQKSIQNKVQAIQLWNQQFEAALARGKYPPERPEFDGEKGISKYPSSLYNMMINPVKRFPVAGIIVYLEKQYAEKPDEYFDKIAALVDGVRADFNRPEMPMIIVNTADVAHPGVKQLLASRKFVKVVPGVGNGGWKDVLPPKTVATSLFTAATEIKEGK